MSCLSSIVYEWLIHLTKHNLPYKLIKFLGTRVVRISCFKSTSAWIWGTKGHMTGLQMSMKVHTDIWHNLY